MIKKIICAAMIIATVAAFASCGCSSGPEPTNPPVSIAITPKIQTAQYAAIVTDYKWINDKSGDTLTFNDNGTFSGKINKESYNGTFTLKSDKKNPGTVYSDITLKGAKKPVTWTLKFKDSAHMTLTTDKKVSEDYACEWTFDEKETK